MNIKPSHNEDESRSDSLAHLKAREITTDGDGVKTTYQLINEALLNPNNTPADTYKKILEELMNFIPKNLRVELIKNARAGDFISSKEMSYKYRIAHALNEASISFLTVFLTSFLMTEIMQIPHVGSFFDSTPAGFLDNNGKAALKNLLQNNVTELVTRLISTLSPAGLFENYTQVDSGLLEGFRYESNTKQLIRDIRSSDAISDQLSEELIRKAGDKTNYYNFNGLQNQPLIRYIKRFFYNTANQLRASKQIKVSKVLNRLKKKVPLPIAYIGAYGYLVVNAVKGQIFTLFTRSEINNVTQSQLSQILKRGLGITKGNLLVAAISGVATVVQDTFNNIQKTSPEYIANIGLQQSINFRHYLPIVATNDRSIFGFSKKAAVEVVLSSVFSLITNDIMDKEISEALLGNDLKLLPSAIQMLYSTAESNVEVVTSNKVLVVTMKLAGILKNGRKKSDTSSVLPSSFTSEETENGLRSTYIEIRAMQEGINHYIKLLNDKPEIMASKYLKQNCLLHLFQHKRNLENINEKLLEGWKIIQKKIIEKAPPDEIEAMQKKFIQIIIGSIISAQKQHSEYIKILTLIEQEYGKSEAEKLGLNQEEGIITKLASLPPAVPVRDKVFEGFNTEKVEKCFGVTEEFKRETEKLSAISKDTSRPQQLSVAEMNLLKKSQEWRMKSSKNQALSKTPPSKVSQFRKAWFFLTGRQNRLKTGILSSAQLDIRAMSQEDAAKAKVLTAVQPLTSDIDDSPRFDIGNLTAVNISSHLSMPEQPSQDSTGDKASNHNKAVSSERVHNGKNFNDNSVAR